METTLNLTRVFYWPAFCGVFAPALAFGAYWIGGKLVSGKQDVPDATFYAVLGGLAVSVALLLFWFMPGGVPGRQGHTNRSGRLEGSRPTNQKSDRDTITTGAIEPVGGLHRNPGDHPAPGPHCGRDDVVNYGGNPNRYRHG